MRGSTTRQSLGPPLVVSLESVLQRPDDPREALDYSYQRQLESLAKVRRGVADVATSVKRVELQIVTLERQASKLAGQREHATATGRADLAQEAYMREAEIREQLSGLRDRLLILTGEEEKLTTASQRLQAKVEAFRVQKETLKATYTAAEAAQTVREAFALTGTDTDDPRSGEGGPLGGGGPRYLLRERDPAGNPGSHTAVPGQSRPG